VESKQPSGLVISSIGTKFNNSHQKYKQSRKMQEQSTSTPEVPKDDFEERRLKSIEKFLEDSARKRLEIQEACTSILKKKYRAGVVVIP